MVSLGRPAVDWLWVLFGLWSVEEEACGGDLVIIPASERGWDKDTDWRCCGRKGLNWLDLSLTRSDTLAMQPRLQTPAMRIYLPVPFIFISVYPSTSSHPASVHLLPLDLSSPPPCPCLSSQ